MNKIEEIFKAWVIAYDPTNEQNELAIKRLEICEGCEHKTEVPVKLCTKCGCALRKKIFSPVKGACPVNKWDEIDSKFLTD